MATSASGDYANDKYFIDKGLPVEQIIIVYKLIQSYFHGIKIRTQTMHDVSSKSTSSTDCLMDNTLMGMKHYLLSTIIID